MSNSLVLIGWTDETIQCHFRNEIILLYIILLAQLNIQMLFFLFVNSTSVTQTVQLWAAVQPGVLATSC